MNLKLLQAAACATLVAGLSACGGGSAATGTSPGDPPAQSSQMALIISDASSDDWATIGVKIISIALTPQGGGNPVMVYSAPATPPMVNLEQLDQIGELLGNAAVPAGTYTGATVTIAANPADVDLVVSAEPEAGFAGTPGEEIPTSDIQIVGARGASGSLTVPVNVTFSSPLVVTASGSNALDLDFDLSHPAFIVAHSPPGASATQWAVNFAGPVRRRPITDIARLVLREMYGNVTAVATDGSSITIGKDLPRLPVTDPETPVATVQSLTIQADATHGTIFHDVDAKTSTTLTSFSSEASSLVGRYGLANNAFAMTLSGGTTPGTVDIDTTSGSATLVYQVDRSNGAVSISPIDVTAANGLTTLTNSLVSGTPVKVFGTPQADGTFRAYVLLYFTGTQPAS